MTNSYLSIRINKIKQVYSNLFHPQYLRRYKQSNFQFYSEILLNLYEKTLFLQDFLEMQVSFNGRMEALSKKFY